MTGTETVPGTGPELGTTYLGLELRSPVVASASPLTGSLERLIELDGAGIGAVVLPSLFEEQLDSEALAIDRVLSTGADSVGEASSFFPDLANYNTGPDRYLTLIEQACESVSVPVIASLNGISVGGWVRFATLIEEAGAAALELNVYRVAADPSQPGAAIEDDTVDLVEAVRGAVSLPIAVKLSPYWSGLAHLACRLEAAGADGLVLFNRFAQPDLDLESLAAVPRLSLSHPDEVRLPLRWIGLLRGHLGCSLAASSGIRDWAAVAKVLLAGADVAMSTSALLDDGPGVVTALLDGLRSWMVECGYDSVRQLQGSAAQHTGPDPVAFERATYARALKSRPL